MAFLPIGNVGISWRNVKRRKPYKRSTPKSGSVDQRICRNGRFMTIEVEVYFNKGSVREEGMNVKHKKSCARKYGAG